MHPDRKHSVHSRFSADMFTGARKRTSHAPQYTVFHLVPTIRNVYFWMIFYVDSLSLIGDSV